MTKAAFYGAYFLSPLVPIMIYIATLSVPIDLYGLSVMLGITAFVFLCSQFILASRPAWAIKALGQKELTRFHSTMPALIVALAVVHKTIKELAGFDTESLQADFGAASLAIFVVVIIFAALFMATTFWMKMDLLKKFKALVYERTGLDYKRARFLHNLTVGAALLLLIHVLFASTSRFSENPLGAFVMMGWMIASLGFYARYRVNGRATAPKAGFQKSSS